MCSRKPLEVMQVDRSDSFLESSHSISPTLQALDNSQIIVEVFGIQGLEDIATAYLLDLHV
jgi:hypothetical protein